MRTRIGIIAAYLLLGCILLEDAFPYFACSDTITFCEAKTESEEKEAKKETSDEWSEAKERLQSASCPAFASFQFHTGSLMADSDEIPDSAHQSIFSPPPEQV
jgi:hypothetical protein